MAVLTSSREIRSKRADRGTRTVLSTDYLANSYAANASVPIEERIYNVFNRLLKQKSDKRVPIHEIRKYLTDASRKQFDYAIEDLEHKKKLRLEVGTSSDPERGIFLPGRGLLMWVLEVPLEMMEEGNDDDLEPEDESDEEKSKIDTSDVRISEERHMEAPAPKTERIESLPLLTVDQARGEELLERIRERSSAPRPGLVFLPPGDAPATPTPEPTPSAALVTKPLPESALEPPAAHSVSALQAFLGDTQVESHPVAVYLARIGKGTRRTASESLAIVAGLLGSTLETLPWHDLRYQHVQAVRSKLVEKYAPSTANKILAYTKGVLREAMRLDQMPPGAYERIRDVQGLRYTRVLRGREIPIEELEKLFKCIDTSTNSGTRDAAILAVLSGGGLRREEVVDLRLESWKNDVLLVHGKFDKEREVPLPANAVTYVDKWISLRGTNPGFLFLPISKTQRILYRKHGKDGHLTPEAIYWILVRRIAGTCDTEKLSPHDMRRTYISRLLDEGVDTPTVSGLVGHVSYSTTAAYDRRGMQTKKKAVEKLFIPPEVGTGRI